MPLSVDLPEVLEDDVEKLVADGYYETKTQLVREAVKEKVEEESISLPEIDFDFLNKFEDEESYYYLENQSKCVLFGGAYPKPRFWSFSSYIGGLKFDKLEEILFKLVSEFDIPVENTSFAISQQIESSWFGQGVREFLEALKDLRERYRSADNLEPRHTEDAVIKLPIKGGFVILSFERFTSSLENLKDFEVTVVLGGVPLNQSKLTAVFEPYGAEFGTGQEHVLRTVHSRSDRKIETNLGVWSHDYVELEYESLEELGLEPVRELSYRIDYEKEDEDIVGSLIVENPFYQNVERVGKYFGEISHTSIENALLETEYIYCELSETHLRGEGKDYLLENLQVTESKAKEPAVEIKAQASIK